VNVGKLLLIWRLAARDARRHPAEVVLPLIAVTVAIAALTLGLALSTASSSGYAKTRAATAGPDIIATMTDPGPSRRLTTMPEVTAYAGPFFAFSTTIRVRGHEVRSAIEGRDVAPAAVDQPLVTSGTWLRPGGAVIERGFAQALGVRVGDRITVSGRDLPIVGIAISAATAVYPWGDSAQGPGPSDYSGKVWLTTADARTAAGDASGVYLLHLKLTDPTATKRFIRSASTPDISGDTWVNYHTWQDVADTDAKMTRFSQPALVISGWLLGIAATVCLAAIVALRATRYNRRAGLLKAVGATPGTVAAVLLAQYLPTTVVATVLGLTSGTLLAPELADPSAGLLNPVSPPDSGTVLATVVLALAVVLIGTLGPVLRAARVSTVHALADAPSAPVHRSGLASMTAYLPTSLLLGVRLLARRPGRAALTCLGAAATSLMITALLTFHATPSRPLDLGPSALPNVRDGQAGHILLAVTIILGTLSTLNTLILGWSSAAQARRALAVARALGTTPGQVVTALCVAQLLPALPGIVLGIPAALGLYWVFGASIAPPSAAWLSTATLVVLVAIGALTALPAGAHVRLPAGRVLKADSM